MDEREKIFNEIVETERKYLANLELLSKLYLKPIEKNKHIKLSPELRNIISTLTIILNINQTLLKTMESSNKDAIGAAFSRVIPFLKAYTSYFNSYENALNELRSARKENKKFGDWLDKTEKNAKKNGQLAMTSYLIQPVQRIPRYNLLLNELIKKTDSDHSDYRNLSNCLAETKKVAAHLDYAMEEMENRARMTSIQQSLMRNDGYFQLYKYSIVQPHRKYMGELNVYKHPSERLLTESDPHTFVRKPMTADSTESNDSGQRTLFLFSDILLICKESTKEERLLFNSLKHQRGLLHDKDAARRTMQSAPSTESPLTSTPSPSSSPLAARASFSGMGALSPQPHIDDDHDSFSPSSNGGDAFSNGGAARPLYVVIEEISLTQVPIISAHACTEFESLSEFSKLFPNMFQIVTNSAVMTFCSHESPKSVAKWLSKFETSISNLIKNTNYNMADQPVCKSGGIYPAEVECYFVNVIQRHILASLERDNVRKGMYVLPRSITAPEVNHTLSRSDDVILSEWNLETEQWQILVEGSVYLEKNPSQPNSFKLRFADYGDSAKDCEFIITSESHIRVREDAIFHTWYGSGTEYAIQLPNLQISRKFEQLYDLELIMSVDATALSRASIEHRPDLVEVASVDNIVVLRKEENGEWMFHSIGNLIICKSETDSSILQLYLHDLSTGENHEATLKDGKLPYVDSVNFLHTWFEDQSLYDDGIAFSFQFSDSETSVLVENLYDTIRVSQPKNFLNVGAEFDEREWTVCYTPTELVENEEWYKEQFVSTPETEGTLATNEEYDDQQETTDEQETEQDAEEQETTEQETETETMDVNIASEAVTVVAQEIGEEVETTTDKTEEHPVETTESVVEQQQQQQRQEESDVQTKVEDEVQQQQQEEESPVQEEPQPQPQEQEQEQQQQESQDQSSEPVIETETQRTQPVDTVVQSPPESIEQPPTEPVQKDEALLSPKKPDDSLSKTSPRSPRIQGMSPRRDESTNGDGDESIPEWKRRILQKKKNAEESTSTGPSRNEEDTAGYYPWQIEIMRRKRALAAKVLSSSTTTEAATHPTPQQSEADVAHKDSFRSLRAKFEANK